MKFARKKSLLLTSLTSVYLCYSLPELVGQLVDRQLLCHGEGPRDSLRDVVVAKRDCNILNIKQVLMRQRTQQGRPVSLISKFVHKKWKLYSAFNYRRPIIIAPPYPSR